MVSLIRVEDLEFPKDYYYEPKHSWLRIEKDGSVTVGYDDFAQRAAGEIVFLDLPERGTKVEQFKAFAHVESHKWVGEVISPISGTVIETNEGLLENPRPINDDPYGGGWMLKVEPEALQSELKNLIHGDEDIRKWVRHDIKTVLRKE
ncbi:MAG: glycine cleavage system protein GcvH [Candidatus Bathyarchaeia archaeon]